MTLTWKDGMAIGSGTPIGVTQTGVTQTVKTYGDSPNDSSRKRENPAIGFRPTATSSPGWQSNDATVPTAIAKRPAKFPVAVTRPGRAYDSSRNC